MVARWNMDHLLGNVHGYFSGKRGNIILSRGFFPSLSFIYLFRRDNQMEKDGRIY